jgi:serine O-acetyltransferase
MYQKENQREPTVSPNDTPTQRIRDDTARYLEQELAYVDGEPSELATILIVLRLILITPGYQFVLSRRLQELMASIPVVGRPLRRLLWWITCIVFSSEIAIACEVGGGLYIPHPYGIVLGVSDIGKNVTILQNVTVGRKKLNDKERPKIESGVQVSVGAVILGNITIGRDSIVAANSVVTQDVPPCSLAAGIPAKITPLLPPEPVFTLSSARTPL